MLIPLRWGHTTPEIVGFETSDNLPSFLSFGIRLTGFRPTQLPVKKGARYLAESVFFSRSIVARYTATALLLQTLTMKRKEKL